MTIIAPEIPADLTAAGARLVTEALELLPRVAGLAQQADALEQMLDATRPGLADVEADDAELDRWCDRIGVTTLRQLLIEMAVAIEHQAGSGAPDRAPDVRREAMLAERWLADALAAS